MEDLQDCVRQLEAERSTLMDSVTEKGAAMEALMRRVVELEGGGGAAEGGDGEGGGNPLARAVTAKSAAARRAPAAGGARRVVSPLAPLGGVLVRMDAPITHTPPPLPVRPRAVEGDGGDQRQGLRD
jgi:hypothetical protein